MTVDFTKLNSIPMDTVTKPKALPAGTYFGTIKEFKYDESKEKKTPFVQYIIVPTSNGDDVDPADLDGIELTKKQLRCVFYLTQDSLFRVKEFLENVGIETQGRSLGECIPDAVGLSVMLEVIQKPTQDNSDFYNEVKTIKSV